MAVFLIIAAALLLISYIIGSYFVNYAILRKERPSESFNPEGGSSGNTMYEENRKRLEEEAEIFRDNSKCMISYIEAEDGLKLKGWYYPNNGSRKCVILVHGYMGDHGNMMTLAAKYHSWGYSVLLPDNRAHGESEGKYIGMGWLDRKDISRWMDWLSTVIDEPEIILHGVSMGAATVMMAAGDNHPALKAVVEDCGYTSVWDIFADELKVLLHLPAFPLKDFCSGVMKLKAGYSAKEASSIKQLSKTDIPMLFIHGTEDRFVAFRMLDINYNAKSRGYREKLEIPGARHAESEYTDPEKYYGTVKAFLEKVL